MINVDHKDAVDWENEHSAYVGTSGSGKTQAMAKNPFVNKPGKKRIVILDPHKQFKGAEFESLTGFIKFLGDHEESLDFCVRYTGKRTPEIFELICSAMVEFLDARFKTYMMVDELADSTTAAGKDNTSLGTLLREGRKFGLSFHGTAVRPAEIPKTVWDECKIKYIGILERKSQRKDVADLLDGVSADDLGEIEQMQFYRKNSDRTVELVNIEYSKPPHRI